MIEESLLKSNYIGKDGFFWWIGQVAHGSVWQENSEITKDGSWGARCKVRIIGYHSFDADILSDDDLPWAQVMLDPSLNSTQGGYGQTLHLRGGEACFGFFLDGDDGQQPVVVGLLYRSEGVKNIVPEDVVAKEKSSRFRPFTGHKGNVVKPSQRDSRAEKKLGDTQTPPVSSADVGKVQFDPTSGYTGEETDQFKSDGSGKLQPQFGDAIRGGKEKIPSSSTIQVEQKADRTYISGNGCQNNIIGRITQILQDFMAITNGLDRYLDTYIDPVLNEITNVANLVRSTTNQILGIVRLIMNSMRSTLFKCIVWLFRKLVGLVIPPPQQTIVLEAMKKILDIIFCIIERLPEQIGDFVENLLGDLVDKYINAPICAIEQWTAGVLAQVMNVMESALGNIMSGINWLTDGIGTISGILNQASTIAYQIFSFLECTGLACKTPSVWASKFGPSEQDADDWQKAVSNVNIFKGLSDGLGSIDAAIRDGALYGSDNELFAECNEKVKNPKTQAEISPPRYGTSLGYCIPPILKIYGDGVGASGIPIVDDSGQVISVQLITNGLGYTTPPVASIVDYSGCGQGAEAIVILDDGQNSGSGPKNPDRGTFDPIAGVGATNAGVGATTSRPPLVGPTSGGRKGYPIKEIIVKSPGAGYAKNDPVDLKKAAGDDTDGLGKLSNYISACLTNIFIVSPGYGYTTGDVISDGVNTFKPIVSPSGSIIGIYPLSAPICGYTGTPTLFINSSTGVGAEVVPILEYNPTFIKEDGSLQSRTVGIGITSVIDCV